MTALLDCPAPAKLNLFLHVIARRDDGYHQLQSAMTLVDLADRIDFVLRTDGVITRKNPIEGVPEEQCLTVRAARLLQSATASPLGVDISLRKSIPQGGGLGGGSSDAATTLIALNRLWGCGLGRQQLQELGLALGADVPFFVFGRSAFAEGVGERLELLEIAPHCYAIIHPGIHVPTAEIFRAPELTRNTRPIKISDFSAGARPEDGALVREIFGHNDLEPVAVARYPEIGRALHWLASFGAARMSGSGACVFGVLPTIESARAAIAGLPRGWSGWAIQGLERHPLFDWVDGRG